MTLLIVLCAAALPLFAIPLLPALRELRRRRDAEPLPISDVYPVEQHSQAERFGTMLHDALADAVHRFKDAGAPTGGARKVLQVDYEVVGPLDTYPIHLEEGSRPVVFVRHNGTSLPAETVANRPVFAAGDLTVGQASHVERAYVEGDIRLEDGSSVGAWMHATRDIGIGAGCAVRGSVRSGRVLRLGPGSSFERLHAAEIRFGDAWHWHDGPVPPYTSTTDAKPTFRLHGRAQQLGPGNVLDSALLIPAAHRWEGDLVVMGDLRIGRDAVILGDVKATGRVTLQSGARVEGHLFAGQGIVIGSRASVTGTVASEGELRIEWLAEIGLPGAPATATGTRVLADQGTRVFGIVVAIEEGKVATRTGMRREQPTRLAA